MDRLKKGDIIECFDHDDLEMTEEELVNDGYGLIESYDMFTMSWKIKITEVREAADNREVFGENRRDKEEQGNA